MCRQTTNLAGARGWVERERRPQVKQKSLESRRIDDDILFSSPRTQHSRLCTRQPLPLKPFNQEQHTLSLGLRLHRPPKQAEKTLLCAMLHVQFSCVCRPFLSLSLSSPPLSLCRPRSETDARSLHGATEDRSRSRVSADGVVCLSVGCKQVCPFSTRGNWIMFIFHQRLNSQSKR